jgi:hypothetical protein
MKRSDIRRIFARPKNQKSKSTRRGLSASRRKTVRDITGGVCHVCGGKLGSGWQADHVVPVKLGGAHVVENFLPICAECNRLRWSYSPQVLRLIIRMGVYVKHEIRQQTALGQQLVELASKRISHTRDRRRQQRNRGAG